MKAARTKRSNAIMSNLFTLCALCVLCGSFFWIRIEASLSGMARMVGRSPVSINDNQIQLEMVSRSIKKTLLEIDKNSQLVLSVQANQTPNAVMKL